MNLRNYYDEYCAAPRLKRNEYLAKVATVGVGFSLPDAFEEVRDALIPRVRERAYYELLSMVYEKDLAVVDSKKLPTFRPFADHLALGVAVDLPDQISEVSGDLLEKWGVTLDEALEIGRDNLWKRSVGKWEPLAEGVWMSPWQDNLDVNRLAMPTLFRQLTVDGDPVAFAPNRDHLIVTGSRDFVGQGVAAAYANGLLDEPRPMNATPIILDGLEWKAYPFDANHPIASLFRRLEIRSFSEDYATQKSLLEERFEREERDIFVASFMAFENTETKRLRTVATWTETVDTLLPRVDSVVLNVSDGDEKCRALGEAPWDRLVEVVGHRMVRQEGMYPERYRAAEFPSTDEIERLQLEKCGD